jgi:hypothetical protein
MELVSKKKFLKSRATVPFNHHNPKILTFKVTWSQYGTSKDGNQRRDQIHSYDEITIKDHNRARLTQILIQWCESYFSGWGRTDWWGFILSQTLNLKLA